MPTGWTKTDRPLRIALLGWARLSSQGFEGSGYNLSASELGRGLALSGHTVFYLASGMSYRLYGGGRISRRETWGGVECWELINSPNLSTAAFNFQNVEKEIHCPEQSRMVVSWLDEHRIDVVHIHSLEGYSLDVIAAVRASGRPVIVTPHNYWYVCPQVDLLWKERSVCIDYDGGKRCVGCLDFGPPGKNKRKRAVGQTLERWLGPYRADVIRKSMYGVVPSLRRALRLKGAKRWSAPMLNPSSLAEPELALGFEGIGRTSGGDGLVRHDLPLLATEQPREYEASPADQNERMLANGPVHLKVLNAYGTRRQKGIEALNAASLVTPPSDFLRRVHTTMGLAEEKTRWVRLGQPHFDQINRHARRSPFYDVRPWDASSATRPLRFAFFGTTRPNKGLEVVTRAIPLLERSVRERCQIRIHAAGNDWAFRKRLSLYPEVSVFGGYDLYQLIGSWGDYDVGVLPHIWFENSPLVMLEHLHGGKFMISSRLGGPPDWIVPPKNGLLFPAGDFEALARCMTDLVTGKVVIPSPREVHEASVLQSYPAHVKEVEGIYREFLGK